MSGSWRKVENENGYPSYVNEHTNAKTWDHPKFSDIKQTIDECNYIKFSSYRVASKIRVLQRALYMDEIPISMINGIFEKHRLGANEASLHLESYDLEAILSDIYFAANKQNHTNTDIDYATELMQNFLYNVYDRDRKGTLQVIATKIALGLLSSAKLSELYKYLYILCADYNNSVTRFRLQNVLTHLTSVAKFLHEDMHFGPLLIQTTLDSCFKEFPGTIGITERGFLTWLESGPQIMAYLPTLYRMRTAETVVHGGRCSVCGCSPLLGLRYRCLRCSRYTQCQQCFLGARSSRHHKPSHAVQEHCTDTSPRQLTTTVIKRLARLFRCQRGLNTPDFMEPRSLKTDKEYLLKSGECEENNITPLSCPQVQLQVVIRQLELQNKELHNQMSQLHGRNDKEMKKYLEEHRIHIAQQIQKLKLLKDYLQNHQKSEINHLESTPMVRNSHSNFRDKNLDIYSPIVRPPDFSAIPEHSSNLSAENTNNLFKNNTTLESLNPYSVRDISTWIADRPTLRSSSSATSSTYVASTCTQPHTHAKHMHNDLDAVLDKLQQILANNFTLDDSVSCTDNDQLQEAVTEMEGMLTSLIDGVETSRTTSASALNSLDTNTHIQTLF